jgi:broad specificity phosphatase PhoE
MTEVAILARHAESEANVDGTLNGIVSRDVPLTATGRAQSSGLAELLPSLDLVATSEFRRAVDTAAIAAPDVPRIVLPDLNEIGFGEYEGGPYERYREWAGAAGPSDPCPGGGESRAAAVRRYARALRGLLARSERTVLVVAHGLVVRYVLNARDGVDPAPLLEGVPCAEPYALDARELDAAVERLEAWARDPRW